ncbi:PREDICTED: uncharacterized protein LOC105580708 isoform X2 [Cercocebus atys]|uniref:uncharacterized protein LOC105580708 isoform X2 n=1 Tax=Cercocebus atys TaxID=9531 RepID=UPI0005F4846B|nr:PREDICTED: uncharacterized protein LOC105580708 isoform X2 [Cercocebus atys]
MASILFGDLMRVSGSLCISERWSLCTSHGMTASGQLRCSLPLIKCSASSENTAGNSLEPSACCSSFTASPCKVGLYYSWRDAAICYKPKVACPPPPCPLISSLGGPLLILNTRVCVPVILGREGSGTIGWRNAFGTVQQFPTSNRPRSGTQGEPDDPARCQVLPGDWLAESTCISAKESSAISPGLMLPLSSGSLCTALI